jgi:hypothetical protein
MVTVVDCKERKTVQTVWLIVNPTPIFNSEGFMVHYAKLHNFLG